MSEAHDECGVFGAYCPGDDVARMSYFALFALQHRGQESAGIAVANGIEVFCHKSMGLVTQVFHEEHLAALRGHIAIGHVRYSTTGSSNLANAQPILAFWRGSQIAVAHNGNLINALQLRRELEAAGEVFESTNDSEIIARLISRQQTPTIEDAVAAAAGRLEGAFSFVVLAPDRVIALRDAHAIRPLCIGQLDEGRYVFASESCALSVLGARLLREVDPGEMVTASAEGLEARQALTNEGCATCVFEFVYIARPDTNIFGRSLHSVRKRLGHVLAEEHPVPADVVIPVPDSGTPAAIGYAEASRIPFNEGLIKNRYIGRTFIQPDQRIRDRGVEMKFNAVRETLAGRRVVVVDDSIVRGTSQAR
ncbi:MAG TPA: amidophosphoribosyltransferase, partial [Armatimonadota bacterium]|nr:amidophosphoribosyltransferase [Armatimonadota bacterium]